MGKALKILTVIVFVLSIVAFVLGMMNFNKRELLIARTNVLETSIIKLAGTLEAADPVFEGVSDHTEYDIDEVSDMPNDTPAESDFWSTYKDVYEVMGGATMNLNNDASKVTLRQYYYKVNPETNKPDYVNGKPQKNALGVYRTDGPGTMSELLATIQDRANKQQSLLNETRDQLKIVREELEKVIDLLNAEKKAHRQSKATITSLNKKIADLEVQIDGLNKKIAQLEREKLELNDKISSLESELAQKNEEIASQASEISTLKEEIKRLSSIDAVGAVTAGGKDQTSSVILTPGNKGEVVGVNAEYAFVMVKLTDDTMKELLGQDLAGEFAPIEVMVIRDGFEGPAGNIVTRLRIDRISRDGSNIGYADNLYGWEQSPLKVGDKVIY
ncbi:MAG: hypothetical protein IJ444_01475 [Kiritimatiellae bacterium]|nr:hypothetical protein [Kiritimatiellia bacterium]